MVATLTVEGQKVSDLMQSLRESLSYIKTSRELTSPLKPDLYTCAFYKRQEWDDDPYAVLALRIEQD